MSLQFWGKILHVSFTFSLESILVVRLSSLPLSSPLPLSSLLSSFPSLFLLSLLLPVPLLYSPSIFPSADFLTVSETAKEPPQDETGINCPTNLAMEATYINQNFSQQMLVVSLSVSLSVCLLSVCLVSVCLTVCLSTYLSSGYKIVWLLVSLLVFFMFRRGSLILWENQTRLLERRLDKLPLWLTGKQLHNFPLPPSLPPSLHPPISSPTSLHRYLKWNLKEDIGLVARCEYDAVMPTAAHGLSFINIKALNEWDPKVAMSPASSSWTCRSPKLPKCRTLGSK